MGTLFLSSTSVFVSCKDYDDDINKNASDIAAMQTQLTTLQSALAEAKAEAAAAKAAADAANSSLEQKITDLLAQMEGADEATKAAILKQIEDLKSNYATKAEVAAANQKVTDLEAAIEALKAASATKDDLKAVQDQIAAIDLSLLSPEWRAEVDERLGKLESANDICQKQIESQRQVLNALVEALLGDENAAARAAVGAALAAIDEQGNLDAATLEALKKKMQTISEVVDEIAPEGNVITLFVDKKLKSLVFMPQTYYWGVEAAKITRLMPKPYKTVKEDAIWGMIELTSYIDNDEDRDEQVGTKAYPYAQKERVVIYTDVNKDRDLTHDRYSTVNTPIAVMLDAVAEYHVNPSNAVFDDGMKVSVISDNKSYTRAMGNAKVSVLNNGWSVEKGVLNVLLNVEGNVSTVENQADGYTPDNANSAITTFAVQVQYGDTTVTSDYATIVEEVVSDLRLSHVPAKPTTPRNLDTDFIKTGLLNTHCGQCDIYYRGTNRADKMGMHLFATVGEAKDFVQGTGDGQDEVNYQKDIDLTALVETHYTNSNGEHALFNGANFTRNFEYKFELTDFRISNGNQTNESAHAAIYVDPQTGHYMLHPQDPAAGGLNGREYQGENDKATEVVVDRVPLVRVSLIYKSNDGDKVVDYGYLPIRITKGETTVVTPDNAYHAYYSEKTASVTRYNECYSEGGSQVNFIKTDWRQTEEDLMSHKVFYDILGHALTREEFETYYEAASEILDPQDLDQYYIKNEADYLKDPENVTPQFEKLDRTTPSGKLSYVGKIAYEEGIAAGGLGTSILDWTVPAAKVYEIAETAGWDVVVRAIKLESRNRALPDLFVIFVSGKVSIEDKTVEVDMKVIDHRIKEYWYAFGNAEFQQGVDEIHTNVKTPEENTATPWKPTEFANTLQYVFENNFFDGTFAEWMQFSGASSNSTQPFKKSNMTLDIFFDDSNNGRVQKGYYQGVLTTFKLQNTVLGDLSKKNLYASKDNFVTWQRVAYIDETLGPWGGDISTLAELQGIKVRLDETEIAKSLLNYVDHELIGAEDVLNATVAVLPKVNGTAAPTVEFDGDKAYIKSVVKYTHDGETEWCKLYIKNYKFDVRYLRPVSLNKLDEAEIVDAASKEDSKQSIRLSELVGGYTDFRGTQTKPNWKVAGKDGATIDYEEYYAPAGATKFIIRVVDCNPGDNLSENPNVKTNLNQADPKTFVPLSTVSKNIMFKVDDTDADLIWYENAGSTVQEFQIQIPVTIEYYWGTIYDNVTVTVKKTLANARQK